MTTLYYSADEQQSAGFRPPDLDSAFNDGFRANADSTGSSFTRWVVIVWSVAAWCAGTIVMTKSLIEAAPVAWNALQRWLA